MRLSEFDKTVRLIPGREIVDTYARMPENENLFKRFKYLSPRHLENEEVLTVLDGKQIVGAAGLEKSPYEENVYWMKYVEVDSRVREKGIASKLIQAMFDFARKRKTRLRSSSYSDMGDLRLKKVVDRVRTEYPDVPYKDANDHTHFK